MDALIRRYGYHGTPYLMEQYRAGAFGDHYGGGASDSRLFRPVPNYLCRRSGAPFPRKRSKRWASGLQTSGEAMRRYSPETLQDGFQTLENGENLFCADARARLVAREIMQFGFGEDIRKAFEVLLGRQCWRG